MLPHRFRSDAVSLLTLLAALETLRRGFPTVVSVPDEQERIKLVAAFLEKHAAAKRLPAKVIREAAKIDPVFRAFIAKRETGVGSHLRNSNEVVRLAAAYLTARETEVLRLVANGQANKHVATDLGISIKTVEKHRQHIMDKLNIHGTAGLTRYALSHNLVGDGSRMPFLVQPQERSA